MAFPLGACSLFEGERCACARVLGHEGYSAIAASGNTDNRALAMRVAARQVRDGTLLITR
jgi:hypothetical protein